jgi:hypothetical protein
MYNAGQACPFVLLLGANEISLTEIQKASPSTHIILRIFREDNDNPLMPFDQYYNMITSISPERKKAKWHQQKNEYNVFTPGYIDWQIRQFELAEALGTRITYLDYAVGNPGEEQGVFRWFWTRSDVHAMMRRANDPRFVGDTPHILNLHQYDRGDVATCDWTGENDIMRWEKKTIPLLPADLQAKRPLYVHTEFGQQRIRFLPLDRLTWKMSNAQLEMQDDDQCLGGALWTILYSGPEWVGDDLIYEDASRLQVLPRLYGA